MCTYMHTYLVHADHRIAAYKHGHVLFFVDKLYVCVVIYTYNIYIHTYTHTHIYIYTSVCKSDDVCMSV